MLIFNLTAHYYKFRDRKAKPKSVYGNEFALITKSVRKLPIENKYHRIMMSKSTDFDSLPIFDPEVNRKPSKADLSPPQQNEISNNKLIEVPPESSNNNRISYILSK